MIPLPPALLPWEPALRALTPDILETVGGWLPRVDAMVGQWFRSDDITGEPDGYASITRRGPYERLLLSEWALADLYPDEFVRRALAGEHAFFSLQHKAIRRQRQLHVVIDAGPEQLGAPRLLHIALLIVLARRAAAAGIGMTFHGLDGVPISHTVDEASLRDLMQARAPADLTESVDAWRRDDADLWWIGGPTLMNAVGDDGVRVCIEQPWRAQTPHLRVSCQWRTQRLAPFTLPLPDDKVASRILRWEPKPSDDPAHAVGDTFVVSPDGNRLFTREPGGRVVGHHIPGSVNAHHGRPRFHPPRPDERIIAAGLSGPRLLMVGIANGKFRVKNGAQVYEVAPEQPLADFASLRLCLNDGRSTNFIDDSGGLWMATAEHARVVLPRCIAMGYGLFVGERGVYQKTGGLELELVIAHDVPLRALVGADSTVAIETRPHEWEVFSHSLKKRTSLGIDAHAVGVIMDRGEPTLVVLDDDRHSISFVGKSNSRSTPRTNSEIAAATVSLNGRSVVYRTRSGALKMYSLQTHAVVRTLRVAP